MAENNSKNQKKEDITKHLDTILSSYLGDSFRD